MTKSRRLAYLALLLTAVIWGSTIAVAKGTFDLLTPAQFLYFRYLATSTLTLPFLIYYLFRLRPKLRLLTKITIFELLGTALPLLILYEGVGRTSAIESSLISATSPIFTVLGGVLFLKERETKREWQGLALAFFGTLLLVAEPLFLSHNGAITYSLSGNLMIMAYNLLWTAYCLVAKRLYRRINKLLISLVAFPGYTLFYLTVLNFSHTPLPSPTLLLTSPELALSILYLALFSSLIAGTLYIWAQNKIEASEASIFTYLQGVVAIPVSFLLLSETPSLVALLAITIITFGVYRAEIKPTRRQKHR